MFTNIISYGFNNKKEHTIVVTISHKNNKLIFNIEAPIKHI